MKIIKPSYQIEDFDPVEMLKMIEKAGRICYKSEDKITKDSAEGFVKRIIKRGHFSVLEHRAVTVKIICDRGISHQIVRHRIGAYSQESTRYCNYGANEDGIVVIKPLFFPENSFSYELWEQAMLSCEKAYLTLLLYGKKPEEARSVLPNSLKTEIVCTYNLRQWRHFFQERVPKTAHPQMREISIPLFMEMKKRLPAVFGGYGF